MSEPATFKELKPEELKSGGFIPQRQKDLVVVRCRLPGGRVDTKRLRKMADVADKYGRGEIHVSVRESVEILYVNLADLPKVIRELEEAGQKIASCGKRVRVPTACGGCEYNPNGWVDTVKAAREVDQIFFAIDTPHKFKMGFSGCPIDCMRAREMDLGFQGVAEPNLIKENCTGCTLCVRVCQDNALKMDEKTNLPVRNWDNCILCGDCIKVCNFEAMKPGRVGHFIYVGGKHGKHPHVAYPIAVLVPDGKIPAVIEKTIEWYKQNGKRGERIGNTLDRVGINSFRAHLKEVIGEYLLQPETIAKPRFRKLFYKGVAEAFPEYSKI